MSVWDELCAGLSASESANLRHALAAVLRSLGPDDPFDAPLLDLWIAEHDLRLAAQLDAILHHPRIQALESAWRGLAVLVERVRFDENIRVELLSCSKDDLFADFSAAPEIVRSGLYHVVYNQAFGIFGGQPYGLLCADYDFTPSAEDISLLRQCAAVAAMSHAPFIANCSPNFFNLPDFSGLQRVREVRAALASPRFRLWHAFRASEDARYVGLCLPRVLLRAPYDVDIEPTTPLPYRESCRRHADFLWGRPSFLFAATAAASFARYRWCVHLLGTKAAAGNVVLRWDYPTLPGIWHRCPFEALLTARLAYTLAEEGLISFVYERATRRASILVAPSIQRPRAVITDGQTINDQLGAQLPYVFLVARLAHFLKCVQRERIGAWVDRSSLEGELNKWLRQYISDQPDAQWEVRARRPLRSAAVTVEPVEGQAGWYRCHLQLQPHLTHNSASFTLSLFGKLDRPAGEVASERSA